MVWPEYDGPAPGKKWDNGGIVVEGLNVMVGSSLVVMGCVVLVGVVSWGGVGIVVEFGIVVFGDGCVEVGINDEVVWPVVGGICESAMMFLGVMGEVGEPMILLSRTKTRFCLSVLSISGSNDSGDDLWEPLVCIHLKYLHTKHNQRKPENNKQNY